MKKVLILDDEADLADEIKDAVEESNPEISCTIELKLDQSAELIAKLCPDAIVLDLMEENKPTNRPGERTWSTVWEHSFCPIIVHTGSDADLQPPVPTTHPFVKRIQKDGGSIAKIVEALDAFAPAVRSVRKLRTEVEAVIHQVLRDTVGDGHMPMDEDAYLLHAGRRRIAASMDSPTITGNRRMASWEQYLIPAVGESPLTADLLRKRDAQWDDPTAYRLILTPSCDLVMGRCEPTLTTACCEGPLRITQKLSLSLDPTKLDKSAGTLISKALSAGAFMGLYPLPSFPSHIPAMIADLKGLEVIDWNSIGPADSNTHDYLRIASIDSPFREQVAWAYITTAARPGMPDRALEPWAVELIQGASPLNP